MKKLKLSQAEIDQLVSVERRVVPPTVQGHGYNDVNFKIWVDEGKNCWQYVLWLSMLHRCFNNGFKAKYPRYLDVTCSDDWLSFASFLQWINGEVEYSGKPYGLELDKDILGRGRKLYSAETCALVPQAINSLIVGCDDLHNGLPNGVSYNRRDNSFQGHIRVGGKLTTVGQYPSVEQTSMAYKTAKEAYIKAVANQYKDVLRPAVYESLMNWEITP